MNSGTWVKCTISNGHISQVLFLSQRGIYGNDQTVRMLKKNFLVSFRKVQCVDRMSKCAVDICSGKAEGIELVTDIRPEAITGGTVASDAEKNKFRPAARTCENAFVQESGNLKGTVLLSGVNIKSHITSDCVNVKEKYGYADIALLYP